MSICGTCGKSIGDGIVYGAKYSNKTFCSPWCASAYDDKHLMYQRQGRRAGEDMTVKGTTYEIQIFNKAGERVARIAVASPEHGKEMLPRLKESVLWEDCTFQLIEKESVYWLTER